MNISFKKADENIWPINISGYGVENLNRAISNYLGSDFDFYVKVYHSVYLDLADSGRFSHEEVYGTKDKNPQTKFDELLAGATMIGQGAPEDLFRNKSKYQRTLWSKLFEDQGLKFKETANPDILRKAFGGSFPSNIYGFCDYGFDEIESTELSKLLVEYGYPKINCYYDHLSSGLLAEVDDYLDAEIMFSVDTASFAALIASDIDEPRFWGSPNLIWTNDRSFLIWSNYDLPYSFIGCNRYFLELIKRTTLEYQLTSKDLVYSFVSKEEYNTPGA